MEKRIQEGEIMPIVVNGQRRDDNEVEEFTRIYCSKCGAGYPDFMIYCPVCKIPLKDSKGSIEKIYVVIEMR